MQVTCQYPFSPQKFRQLFICFSLTSLLLLLVVPSSLQSTPPQHFLCANVNCDTHIGSVMLTRSLVDQVLGDLQEGEQVEVLGRPHSAVNQFWLIQKAGKKSLINGDFLKDVPASSELTGASLVTGNNPFYTKDNAHTTPVETPLVQNQPKPTSEALGNPSASEVKVEKPTQGNEFTENVPKQSEEKPTAENAPESRKVTTAEVSSEASTKTHPSSGKQPESVETKLPTERLPESVETKLPTEKLPESVETKPPTEKLPESVDTKPQTEKLPESVETKPPTEKLPETVETKLPTEKLPELVETKPPTEKLPESVETKLPTEKLPESVETKPPSEKLPESVETKPPTEKLPESVETKPPAEKLPESVETKPPSEKLPESVETKPPTEKLPESVETKPPTEKLPESVETKVPTEKQSGYVKSEEPSNVQNEPGKTEAPGTNVNQPQEPPVLAKPDATVPVVPNETIRSSHTVETNKVVEDVTKEVSEGSEKEREPSPDTASPITDSVPNMSAQLKTPAPSEVLAPSAEEQSATAVKGATETEKKPELSEDVSKPGQEDSSNASNLVPTAPKDEIPNPSQHDEAHQSILRPPSDHHDCLVHMAEHSRYLQFAMRSLELMKRPIRQVLTLLPNDTAANLQEDLQHFTHLSVETLALAIVLSSFLMTLFTLTRCGGLFRSDWRNVLARQYDHITCLEDKVAEKERANASITDWNVSLTKQVKCYEIELGHLKSTTMTRDSHVSKDLQDAREKLADLDIKNQHLQGQVEALEHQLAEMAREREDLVEREMEKAAQVSADHLRAMSEKETLLKEKVNELKAVLSEREELREQVTAYYQQLNEMKQELSEAEKARKEWENNAYRKEAEIETLKLSFQQLKLLNNEVEDLMQTSKSSAAPKKASRKENDEISGWDFEEDDGEDLEVVVQEKPSNQSTEAVVNEEVLQQKLDSFFNCNKLRSDLQAECEKVARLTDSLTAESEQRKRLEERLDELEREGRTVREALRESEDRRVASEKKLEILSDYFKAREVEFQVNVGKEVVEKRHTAQDYTNERQRREVLEEELSMIREHVKTMKQELEESSRQYRKQILQIEKRAHESWLNARAAEREVKELKEENTALRQRCYENISSNKALPSLPGLFPPHLPMLPPPPPSTGNGPSSHLPPFMPPFGFPPMFPPGMSASNTESFGELAATSGVARPGSRHSVQSDLISPGGNSSDREWKSPPSGQQRSNSRGASLPPPPAMFPPHHLMFPPPMPPTFNSSQSVHNNHTTDLPFPRH